MSVDLDLEAVEKFIECIGEARVVGVSEDVVYSSVLIEVVLNACAATTLVSYR